MVTGRDAVMRARSWPNSEALVCYAGALLLVAAVVHAAFRFTEVSPEGWGLTVVYAVTIVVGELWHVSVLGTRDFPPIALAASLALPMTTILPGRLDVGYSAGFVVIVVTLSTCVGQWSRRALGEGDFAIRQVAARVIVVSLAAVVYRRVPLEGRTLAEWVWDWQEMKWLTALTMIAVALLAMGLKVVLLAIRHSSTHTLQWQALVDEVRAVGLLMLATASAAAVIALAVSALGPVAIPLFLTPLLLLQLAVSRQSDVREAQRQTIRSLSRLTDQGGFTPPGHGARVADLALAMGRDLGLAERDLVDLEYSALLHDLGQVALRRPIPGGSTTAIAPLDQRRIAQTGASILARTAELSSLSQVIAGQATPYRHGRDGAELVLESRILRVSNAFDDLGGPEGRGPAARRALDRIRLNLGYDYDPLVVRSLCRVLVREGRITERDVAELDL